MSMNAASLFIAGKMRLMTMTFSNPATLSHPNVVQIFDVGLIDGSYFIAMEHVHGEDLRSIVRQMKRKDLTEFPLEHAVAIVSGMCAGLAYAHDKRDLEGNALNIVHRDISPQNVVVAFTGDVKVVDFGIAKSDVKQPGEGTKSGKLKGKVPYMSPEQARGEPVDWRSDIFAAGVMLFELTTGKRLFKGPSEYETLKLICEREYPSPSHVRPGYPPELEQIVLKALAKDKTKRWQSARDMQAALEEFARSERIMLSTIALSQFMQGLFEEKLVSQKEALLQGKQLADVFYRDAGVLPDGSVEPPSDRPSMGDLELLGQTSTGLLSTPAASRTVTEARAHRARTPLVLAALAGSLVAAGMAFGAFAWMRSQTGGATAGATAATVEPAPARRGSLRVESEPPGAAIWVNGDLRAEVTPATLAELPLDHALDVKVTKDGFEQSRASVTLAAGAEGRVVATLKAREAPAPAPATAPAAPAANAAPSAHHARAAATDKPKELGNGKLNVSASGGWCLVSVDGAAKGPTPVAGMELPVGAHKVTCAPEGKPPMTAMVNVGVGETARYRFTLTP